MSLLYYSGKGASVTGLSLFTPFLIYHCYSFYNDYRLRNPRASVSQSTMQRAKKKSFDDVSKHRNKLKIQLQIVTHIAVLLFFSNSITNVLS